MTRASLTVLSATAAIREQRLRPEPVVRATLSGPFARVYLSGVALHMIKLVVGAETVEDLLDWRRRNREQEPEWKVRTRQTPKRAEELAEGGSIYRVLKGAILCRQPILRIDTVGEGRQSRCEIVVAEEVVRVAPTARRPFQGWRYFLDHEAPPDLDGVPGPDVVPSALALKLRELGAW